MTTAKRRIGALFAGVLILSSCSPNEGKLWQQFISKRSVAPSRRPAQAVGKCFADRLDPAQIKVEIDQFEANYPNQKKSSGVVFGTMRFSELGAPTADFLGARGYLQLGNGATWIAYSPSQSSCRTADCFLQALYANRSGASPGDLDSLLHYWFFLKTGIVVSAQKAYPWYRDPQVVTLSPGNVELQRYLFSTDEWRAWWKMAQLLPPSMLHLPSLQTIHRLPRGLRPDEWKRTLNCRTSMGPWNSGWALFEDGCLGLNRKTPLDTKASYFFPATTHEFAHRLSVWAFNQLHESPDFLALSEWKKDELVSASGQVRTQWASNPKADFVSSFATQDPSEDFAETVAYFRTNPSWVKDHVPVKYEFVKKRVFNGQGYTPAELQAEYTDRIAQDVLKNIDTWVQPCLAAKPAVPAITNPTYQRFFDAVSFGSKLDESIKSCVQAQVVNQMAQTVLDLRYFEPEGCDILDRSEQEVLQAAASSVRQKLVSLFKDGSALKDVGKSLQDFRKAEEHDFDSRALYLSCWKKDDPRVCYETGLDTQFKTIFEKEKSLLAFSGPETAASELQRFKASNSFDAVGAKVSEFYQGLMASALSKIDDGAETLWSQCRSVVSAMDPSRAKLEPYTAGAAFVPPEVLDCLNRGLEDEFTRLRAFAVADQSVTLDSAAETRDWIDGKILFPRYKTILDHKIADVEAEDQTRFDQTKAGVVEEISGWMTANYQTWQPGGGAFLYAACKNESQIKLGEKFPATQYRFMSLGPALDGFANQICEKVRVWTIQQAKTTTADPQEPKPEVPAMMVERVSDTLWAKLGPLVLAQAKTRFDKCHTKIYLTQKLRRYCLFSERVVDDQDNDKKDAWAWMRDRGLRAWMKDPEVQKYRMGKGYSEAAYFEAAQARADDESDPIVELVLGAFYDNGDGVSSEN